MNAADNLCPYVLLFAAKSGDRYVCTLKGKPINQDNNPCENCKHLKIKHHDNN